MGAPPEGDARDEGERIPIGKELKPNSRMLNQIVLFLGYAAYHQDDN